MTVSIYIKEDVSDCGYNDGYYGYPLYARVTVTCDFYNVSGMHAYIYTVYIYTTPTINDFLFFFVFTLTDVTSSRDNSGLSGVLGILVVLLIGCCLCFCIPLCCRICCCVVVLICDSKGH